MDAEGASVFITKAAAARRQLDAAIRFWFAEEDGLVIHTVGAAAYRILRDLMENRDLQPAGEFVRAGLFSFAKSVAEGQQVNFPDDATTQALINSLAEAIKAGEISSPEDISPVRDRKGWWKNYNLPADFLKHADRDPDANIVESEIDNNSLLLGACGTYARLFSDSSAEMMLFYVAAADEIEPSALNDELFKRIRDLSPPQRKKACLACLSEVRARFSS